MTKKDKNELKELLDNWSKVKCCCCGAEVTNRTIKEQYEKGSKWQYLANGRWCCGGCRAEIVKNFIFNDE